MPYNIITLNMFVPYCCIDRYIIKPKICIIESALVRRMCHGLSIIVHFTIASILSTLIYYGCNRISESANGNDLLLIVPNSVSLVLMVWTLLCSFSGLGCEKGLKEDMYNFVGEIIQVEAIDPSLDCNMLRNYAFETLMIMHGTLLGIGGGRAPIAAKYRDSYGDDELSLVTELTYANMGLLFIAFIMCPFYLRNIMWFTPTPPVFFRIYALEPKMVNVKRRATDFEIFEEKGIIPLRVIETFGSIQKFAKNFLEWQIAKKCRTQKIV